MTIKIDRLESQKLNTGLFLYIYFQFPFVFLTRHLSTSYNDGPEMEIVDYAF